jgi:small multidrug resistance pump
LITEPCTDESLARYRHWFYAAAIYNLLWGGLNVFFPHALFDLIGMERPSFTPIWQVVGMFVLVYAPAYWWAARHPARHRHLIAIGLLGKILGPIGFFWSAPTGQLPWSFAWVILTNDLIWWPAFFAYTIAVARRCGGFAALLRGE